jgi:hypothetical protein
MKVGAYHGRHRIEGFAVGARDGDGIGGGGGIQTTRAVTEGGVEVSTVGDGDSGRLGRVGKVPETGMGGLGWCRPLVLGAPAALPGPGRAGRGRARAASPGCGRTWAGLDLVPARGQRRAVGGRWPALGFGTRSHEGVGQEQTREKINSFQEKQSNGQGHNSHFTTRVPHVRWVQPLSPDGIHPKWHIRQQASGTWHTCAGELFHGIQVTGNFFNGMYVNDSGCSGHR